MANGYTNSSYERCMAELRARYSKRGVNAGVKHSSESVEKIDEEISFERVSFVSDEYRSGSYNGNKYMTSDDFVRYFIFRSQIKKDKEMQLHKILLGAGILRIRFYSILHKPEVTA